MIKKKFRGQKCRAEVRLSKGLDVGMTHDYDNMLP